MHTLPTVVAVLSLTLASTSVWAQDEDEAKTRDAEEIHATQVGDSTTGSESAATSAAQDDRSPIDGVVGHYGFGYFTGSAPVGLRYWMDRDTAIDLGVDVAFSSGNLGAQRYGVELGYVMALAHYHYAVVFARAGLGFRFLDSFGEEGTPARYDISGNAFLGAELFLGALGFPNISLQGGYGLEADYTYQGGSAFLIGTVSAGLNVVGTGTVGFHIYL